MSPPAATPLTPDEQVEAILRAIAQSAPEVRSRLGSCGLVIPKFGNSGEVAVRYGYRCQQCNHIALYFLGDRFTDYAGNELMEPPLSVPIDQIPWKQDLPQEHVNRHTPACQNCHHEVALHHRGLRKHLIQDLKVFEASRHESQRLLEQRRRNATMGGRRLAEIPTDGPWSQLSDDFTAHQKLKRVNDALSPEARADIKKADAAGMLYKPIGHST